MRKNNSFRKAWHHLQTSQDYFEDFIRENDKRMRGAIFAKRYSDKIKWMVQDFKASPIMDAETKADFVDTLNQDHFFYEEIAAKCIDLMPQHKTIILEIIDRVLQGEKLQIELKP